MFETRSGGCQCGGVRYEVTATPLALAVCHCSECKRQSGSAFGMSLVVEKKAFRVTAGELRSFSRQSDSGRAIECLFCPQCGNRIYHNPTYMEGVVNVKAGTLDDTTWLQPDMHVWVKNKDPWVPIADGTKCFDGQP